MDERDDRAHARAPEPEDLVRLCRALNDAGARYMLIGGFAVIAHGGARFTKDIDVLIDDAPENVRRVKRALSILQDNAVAAVDENDIREHTVVRVADEIIVDLMGRACGISYEEAARDVETLTVDGVPIPVAGLTTLIRTKDTYRPQDAIDRAFLQSLAEKRRR